MRVRILRGRRFVDKLASSDAERGEFDLEGELSLDTREGETLRELSITLGTTTRGAEREVHYYAVLVSS